jgi:hypothetical protein
MTREQKLSAFGELTRRHPKIQTGTEFAADRARLLIDHPAAGLTWHIDGASSSPGFYYLSTEILLDYSKDQETPPAAWSRWSLLLPEDAFERIQ